MVLKLERKKLKVKEIRTGKTQPVSQGTEKDERSHVTCTCSLQNNALNTVTI